MKQNERRTAFILAAGLGTRLKELTSDKPKALVELNKQPLLKVVIENLISQKFNHFVINVHHYADKIVDFIESVKYENVEFEISDERDFLYNTGGAIIKALPYFKESKAVLIHNVDIVSDIDFQSIYDGFVKSKDAAWLLTQERNNKRKIVFDDNNNFVGRLNLETKEYDGEIKECDEGVPEWVAKEEVKNLPLWEGDKIFFDLLEKEIPFFSLKLEYKGDDLVRAVLNNKQL